MAKKPELRMYGNMLAYKNPRTGLIEEWTMDDEIEFVKRRDRTHRNTVLILIALALGAVLKFLVASS